MIRRICILLVAVGAGLLFFRHATSLPTLPLPPAGRLVKGIATIGSAGDYSICVTMPKIDDSFGLSPETVACFFVVSVTQHGKPAQKKEITSLTRYSEFGFGRTQDYRGGDAFRLGQGEHEIEVSCRETSAAITTRGATLTLERDVGNPTDYYLSSLLRRWLAIGALCGGLLGLVICEFKRPIKRAIDNDGAAPRHV